MTETSDNSPDKPLDEVLFDDSGESNLFAVIDGAKIDSLLGVFAELDPPRACLFAGKLEPSVAKVAPYLVALVPDHPFSAWFLERHRGKSCGIFLRSREELDAVRKHLKRFTMVRLPDGEQAYFRFYDPRVLRVYLPTCRDEEVEQLFGDVVQAYVAESEDRGAALEFRREETATPQIHRLAQ